MIVPDANILLYAWDSSSALHSPAKAWVEASFSSGDQVGIAWQNIAAFLRIVTNPRLLAHRFTMHEAVGVVESWLDQPAVTILTPGEQHWRLLRDILFQSQVVGPDVTDAQLAALTIEYGGTLYTTDRGFARFPGLRWANPLNP